MEVRTVRLESDDKRWLELRVEDGGASARVGDTESFPFNYEHLGFVASGMGYQAWGGGSHFAFRRAPGGAVVEFQGPGDRNAAVCRLSDARLRETIDDLDALLPSGRGASVR